MNKMEAILKLIGGSAFQGDCIVWKKGKTKAGYGQVCLDGSIFYAHRLAHEVFIGPLGNLFALHRCDNPACWNPAHLFAGTQQDNLLDMRKKNRQAHGERVGTSKITAKQALSIIHDDRVQDVIAAQYGLTQSQVSRIKSKQRWNHL